jgi:hypothetical protein
MIARFLGALALVTALAGSGAMAQVPPGAALSGCATEDAVGRWLHDSQGAKIGSVRALTDGGQSAVIMLGFYFQLNLHEAVVPACAITVAADGRVTLRREATEALNAPASR